MSMLYREGSVAGDGGGFRICREPGMIIPASQGQAAPPTHLPQVWPAGRRLWPCLPSTFWVLARVDEILLRQGLVKSLSGLG